MKLLLLAGSLVIGTAIFSSCQDADGRYVDLRSGDGIKLKEDEKTGKMVDVKTGETVHFYVDTRTKDTIDGRTGKVVNGLIVKSSAGSYAYIDAEGDDYKIKGDDYKMKVEKDGDIKIKDGDKKVKIDGETGEKKVKKD